MKLNEVCAFKSGGTPSKANPKYWVGEIPWVSPKDMRSLEIHDATDHISEDAAAESAPNLVEPGSILVVVRSGILIHEVPVALATARLAFNQDIKGITPSGALMPKFLLYYLRDRRTAILANGVKRGATVHSVGSGYLENLLIALPTSSEQRRIVEILDQADATRKKRAEANKLAARILPALFYHMFGDPVTLERRARSVPLEEFDVEVSTGFACGDKDVADGVPHLRMNNITDKGELSFSLVRTVPLDEDTEERRLNPGDVLMMGTNSEDRVGMSCVFQPKDGRHYLFSNHLVRIRLADGRITPEYLAWYMHLLWRGGYFTSVIRRWVNQAALPIPELKRVRVHCPEGQAARTFSRAVGAVRTVAAHQAAGSESIDGLFATVLHRAFSGELTAKWREKNKALVAKEMAEQKRILNTTKEE